MGHLLLLYVSLAFFSAHVTLQSRMKQLADSIAHQKQLQHLQHDREQQEVSMVLGPASFAATFAAVPEAAVDDGGGSADVGGLDDASQEPEVVQLRHQRQQEELTAAIQALVGVEVRVDVM